MTLAEFLKRECGNHAPWHCSTMAADWCIALGYPDFAAAWRDVFEPSACDATADAAGGLLNLWNEGIGDGLPVVKDRRGGDIAVITALGVEAGAIWTGERWALRSTDGTVAWLNDAPRICALKSWRP